MFVRDVIKQHQMPHFTLKGANVNGQSNKYSVKPGNLHKKYEKNVRELSKHTSYQHI